MLAVIFFIIGLVMLVLGGLGTVFPALPGLPLMFGGYWLLAYLGDYSLLSVKSVWIMAGIMIIGEVVDRVASLFGAKLTGSGQKALWGSIVGSIAGLFTFGFIGMAIGVVVGAMLGELLDKRTLLEAGKVGFGTFIGFAVGLISKVMIAAGIFLYVGTLFTLYFGNWLVNIWPW